MAQQNENSLFPDDTGLSNPLVSQQSVEPNVDMNTGFLSVWYLDLQLPMQSVPITQIHNMVIS
jgi:hypothetical protein